MNTLLIVISLLCIPQEPTLTLVVPDKIESGTLVRVSVNADHHGRKPTETKYSWYANNAIDSENLGDRFIFSTKFPKTDVICVGSYYYSTGVPHLEQVTTIVTVTIANSPTPIPPDPKPPEPDPKPSPQVQFPKGDLGKMVATWGQQMPANESYLLAVAYNKTITDIQSGNIKTKEDAISRIAENTKVVLAGNFPIWVNSVLEPLRLELNRRGLKTKTLEDFRNELIDIKDGLDYLGRTK